LINAPLTSSVELISTTPNRGKRKRRKRTGRGSTRSSFVSSVPAAAVRRSKDLPQRAPDGVPRSLFVTTRQEGKGGREEIPVVAEGILDSGTAAALSPHRQEKKKGGKSDRPSDSSKINSIRTFPPPTTRGKRGKKKGLPTDILRRRPSRPTAHSIVPRPPRRKRKKKKKPLATARPELTERFGQISSDKRGKKRGGGGEGGGRLRYVPILCAKFEAVVLHPPASSL